MTRRDCNDLTRTTLVNRDLLRLFLCVTSYASGSPFQLFHTSVTSWVRVEALSGCGAVQARLSAVRLRRVARRSADQSACTADHLFRENRADFGRLRRLSIVPPPRWTVLCCSPTEQHSHTPVPRTVHVQALPRNEQVGAAMRLLSGRSEETHGTTLLTGSTDSASPVWLRRSRSEVRRSVSPLSRATYSEVWYGGCGVAIMVAGPWGSRRALRPTPVSPTGSPHLDKKNLQPVHPGSFASIPVRAGGSPSYPASWKIKRPWLQMVELSGVNHVHKDRRNCRGCRYAAGRRRVNCASRGLSRLERALPCILRRAAVAAAHPLRRMRSGGFWVRHLVGRRHFGRNPRGRVGPAPSPFRVGSKLALLFTPSA